MSKRTFLFLVIIFYLNIGLISAQWALEKTNSKNCLHSISLIDPNSGWIVGDKGTILFKSNSFWIESPKITNKNLYSVCMLDNDDGWAVGAEGIILHFNGKTWEEVISPTDNDLFSISFNDHDNGIAVGMNGTIINYKNGTWSIVKNSTVGHLFSSVYRNNLSFIGGERECVRMPVMTIEKDKEEILTANFTKSLFSVRSICTTGENELWAVGSSRGHIAHFNGSEWIDYNISEKLPTLLSIFFSDDNHGVSVGFRGTILTYSGKGWVKQNSPVKRHLRGASINGDTYYAVGDSGTIVKWRISPSEDHRTDPGKEHMKMEAYPNPCDDLLNIFSPEEDDFAIDFITVTNINGKVIFKEMNIQGSASSTYLLKTAGYDNGLYLVTAISIDGKLASAKFVIKH